MLYLVQWLQNCYLKNFRLRKRAFLQETRAKIVSREHLKQLAFKLGIDKMMIKNAGHDSFRSMYGDALEALIAQFILIKDTRKLVALFLPD